MILKAGTYRFNEALFLPSNWDDASTTIFVDGISYGTDGTLIDVSDIYFSHGGVEYNSESVAETIYTRNSGWTNQLSRDFILNSDVDIDYYSASCFIVNTNYNKVNAPKMTLKAGTYKFNGVLDLTSIPSDIAWFNFTNLDDNYIGMSVINDSGEVYGFAYWFAEDEFETVYTVESGWVNTTYKEHSISNIQVDETFGTWYIANTNYNEVNAKPLAEITYNGETIAQLNAGETATLSCEGKKMVSDIAVKIESGYVKPSGSLSITENGTYPVTDKEEVVVDVPIPDGYVKPEGTLEITLNNIEAEFPIDCAQYAKVTVNTAEPLRISDPTVLDNITDGPWGVGGSVFLYEGATTDSYENGVLYYLEDTEK